MVLTRPLHSAEEVKGTDIATAARSQIGKTLRYDPSYRALDYPNGDVPIEGGVCTDVIVRSLRIALDMDLQRLVHEDMRRNFSSYPKNWGLTRPDKNIDHRRVPNLKTYFKKNGYSLPISMDPQNYRPGDLMTCIVPPNLPHIMIVSDRNNSQGHPLVIHNIGAGAREEDRLFEFKITGHYRIKDSTKRPSTTGIISTDEKPSSQHKKATGNPLSPPTYTVGSKHDGGTLSGIARMFYGDSDQWKRIYEANRRIIKNPDIIRNGMKLKVPRIDRNETLSSRVMKASPPTIRLRISH